MHRLYVRGVSSNKEIWEKLFRSAGSREHGENIKIVHNNHTLIVFFSSFNEILSPPFFAPVSTGISFGGKGGPVSTARFETPFRKSCRSCS